MTLTLTATNLTGTEFVSDWAFNLDPSLDPTALSFAVGSKTGTFDDPTFGTGVDAFQEDGGGKYDIEFSFATSGSGGGIHRFGVGESGTYTITGISTLTANSFDFLSATGGGNGVHPTAAHVQGIGAEGSLSGWVSAPEPSAILLGLLGAAGLFVHIKRRGHNIRRST